MVEVLVKAEKYINGEEAILSKRENSAGQKERSRGEKKNENEAPGDEETRTNPHKETEKNENDPKIGEGMSETAWDHLSPSCSNGIHLNNSPP